MKINTDGAPDIEKLENLLKIYTFGPTVIENLMKTNENQY